MSETIAITGKSVKLFKGHYTSWHVAISAAQGKSAPRAPVREKCGQAPASRSYTPRTRSQKRLHRRGNGATQTDLCPGN
ncbi:MAG: hypothetical protein ACREYE_31475 [Gammaproteobacteria bacterium]